MEEEGAWLVHLKRVIAVAVGLLLGLVAAYLVVAISAGWRKGAEVSIDPKAVGDKPLDSSVFAAAQPAAHSAKAIFHQRCARCHGEKGRGDGPLAYLLSTAPRDLVKGPFWLRSTPWGAAPGVEDLRRVIERGIGGTAMPGFEDAFKDIEADADGRDVVEQLIALLQQRSRYLRKPGKPVEVPEQASGEDWELEAGKLVYKTLQCAKCHGDDGHGAAKAKELKDARGRPLRVPDLTEPWDFRRGGQTEEIWQTLELGFEPRFMPSLGARSSKGDRLALAAYVHSLGRAFLDPAEMRAARESRGLLAQGANMVKLLSCQRCHTPRDARGLPLPRFAFAGGQLVHTASGDYVSANLTSDPKHGIAKLDDAVIGRAITTGETHDGRDIDPQAMPWTWFSMLTSSDLAAIIAHLRNLPARDFAGGRQKDLAAAQAPGRFAQLFGADTWVQNSFAQDAKNVGQPSATDDAHKAADTSADTSADRGADEVKTRQAATQQAAADSAEKDEKIAKSSAPAQAAARKRDPLKEAASADPQGLDALQARYDSAALKLKQAAAEYAASKAALDAARQAVEAANKARKPQKKHRKRRSRRRRHRR